MFNQYYVRFSSSTPVGASRAHDCDDQRLEMSRIYRPVFIGEIRLIRGQTIALAAHHLDGLGFNFTIRGGAAQRIAMGRAMARLQLSMRGLMNPSVPFYIWLRFGVGQRMAEYHRRYLDLPGGVDGGVL